MKIYKEGLEKYPLTHIIGQNIFLLIYFWIGIIGMLPLKIYGFPIISVIYGLFIVIMLLFVLRKYLCTNCYYYGKLCNTGWGKVSALMFKRDSGNINFGLKLAKITWMLITIIPIIVMSFEVYLRMMDFLILGIFIIMSGLNFLIHNRMCKKCKMKFICNSKE